MYVGSLSLPAAAAAALVGTLAADAGAPVVALVGAGGAAGVVEAGAAQASNKNALTPAAPINERNARRRTRSVGDCRWSINSFPSLALRSGADAHSPPQSVRRAGSPVRQRGELRPCHVRIHRVASSVHLKSAVHAGDQVFFANHAGETLDAFR